MRQEKAERDLLVPVPLVLGYLPGPQIGVDIPVQVEACARCGFQELSGRETRLFELLFAPRAGGRRIAGDLWEFATAERRVVKLRLGGDWPLAAGDPIYRIAEDGTVQRHGELTALHGGRTLLRYADGTQALHEGLPWFTGAAVLLSAAPRFEVVVMAALAFIQRAVTGM